MNSVSLTGRLTKDVETRVNNDLTISRFTIAVNRDFKSKDGKTEADFINCIAFGKTAEFIEKYFSKGMRIGVNGRIQTGSYTNKDGQKVYTTDVVIEKAEFEESKANANKEAPKAEDKKELDGFVDVTPDIDAELPFN